MKVCATPRLMVLVALITVCCSAGAFCDEVTSGSLSSLDTPPTLVAPQGWIDTISWNISPTSGGEWHYSYTISNHDGDFVDPSVARLAIGTSSGFGFRLDEGTHSDGVQSWSVTTDKGSQSFYGIRLYGDAGSTCSWTLGFTTSYAPGWGDIYGECGEKPPAWNECFGKDWDEYPWGKCGTPETIVPEPGLAVLGLSALVAGAVARRRTKKETKLSA